MRKLTAALGGSAAVALSVASRAMLFLGLSWHVYASANAEQAANFFQDLFLQSVLITFFSASSFFAVVNKSWDDRQNGLLMLTHVILGVVGTVVVVMLMLTDALSVDPGLLILLLIGALATGMTSPLIGLIVKSKGPWHAYGPSIVVGPLFLGMIALQGLGPIEAAIGAIVAFQVVVFLYLGFVGRQVFADMLAQKWLIWREDLPGAFGATFAFGALNTLLVGYLYWFRETWVPLQAPEVAAAVLFIFRIFDTFLGVVLTDLAGRLDAIKVVEQHRRIWAVVIAILGAAAIFALWLLGTLDLQPFTVAVTGQVLLECLRVPLLVFFLYQGARRSGMGYFVYNAGTVGISYVVLAVIPLQNFPTGFYLFTAITALLSASITCAYAAIRPVSATQRRP
jgi:hypothetical protein